MTNTSDEAKQPRVIHDIWDAILNDSWMWIVVWGKPRTGKTTVQMQCAYQVYKDWDQVLQSFVFNLAGLLYKIDHGQPCRIMTRNMLHNRVPIIIGDDWGAGLNKAKTQHEVAFDLFKGAVDTYATKISVIITSMGSPSSLTQQLQAKYTHELFVQSKGKAKYDVVDWQQNFFAWQPRQKKDWLDSFEFYQVPMDVYKEYDSMRMSLVDELNQLIKDAMAENETLKIMRRLQPVDIEFMELLNKKGMLHSDQLERIENVRFKEVLVRCKARSLVVPVKKQETCQYYYDLTDLGVAVLDYIHTYKDNGNRTVEAQQA